MNIHLYTLIPRKLSSALMYRLARIETIWLKNLIIRCYMRITGANTEFAVEKNAYMYKTLNDFFTRALAENARPIDMDNTTIVSPVDGRCAEFGMVHEGSILQAKGMPYTVESLLGCKEWAQYFVNGGSTATLYLAPDDYHRIHMPCDGHLLAMRFCPGDKHSVSLSLLGKIPNIFAGNERAVCLFETPFGKMAMVLVGALNVSSIETIWHGEIIARSNNFYEYSEKDHTFSKGEEIGRFNLGSTVILFFEKDILGWKRNVLTRETKIRVGEAIAETL
ncbi:MAG: archaetidylserine decarboxylase [Cardiobacteriaceae bacterium]|nr:archaetidylserine decarboxylase [Cardiobacteriaceae bacterium]